MAISLDLTYAKAYLRRAELRIKSGKKKQALADFALAQKHDPDGKVGTEAARRLLELDPPPAPDWGTPGNGTDK